MGTVAPAMFRGRELSKSNHLSAREIENTLHRRGNLLIMLAKKKKKTIDEVFCYQFR